MLTHVQNGCELHVFSTYEDHNSDTKLTFKNGLVSSKCTTTTTLNMLLGEKSWKFAWSFISSYLSGMARTSSTMLNKRGESRHLCLVPSLKGNACRFYLLSMMLAVGLSYMALIMFRYVPSIPTLLGFLP